MSDTQRPDAEASAITLAHKDAERRRALRRMKILSTSLLACAAVIFAIAFTLQNHYPWLGFVRAASEGAMVGALADWFAVTALFRRPLGLPIPHTAIIPTRKDEIGASLGEFVETNFLSDDVVATRLRALDVAGSLARWLAEPANAERITTELSRTLAGVIGLLDEDAMRDVLEHVVRTQLLDPEWGPPLGRLGQSILSSGAQHEVVTLLLERLDLWLAANPAALENVVSSRLPTWMPRFVNRVVDDRTHAELRRLVDDVRADPNHQLRRAIDNWLAELVTRLQQDPGTIARFEKAKLSAFDDPRIRQIAESLWSATKQTATSALTDPHSTLRQRVALALASAANRVSSDNGALQLLNERLTAAVLYLVTTYRHDIASVITETVKGWDATETTEKIETQVGRDLQFIRINGTVVGALAGLAIYTVATLVSSTL